MVDSSVGYGSHERRAVVGYVTIKPGARFSVTGTEIIAPTETGAAASSAGNETNGGATTGHEAELWAMADALRGSMDATAKNLKAPGFLLGEENR